MEPLKIVIHIGLPKTATTSLQDVFRTIDGYIGIRSKNSGLTKKLLATFYKFSKGQDVDRELIGWIEKLEDLRKSKGVCGPVILSDEHFFGGEFNKGPEFPVLLGKQHKADNLKLPQFLRHISIIGKNKNIDINVIMTIRNQYDWVASKYAQASPKIFGASQSDFNQRILRFSKEANSSWLDWSHWVKLLDASFGASRVHILCMEEIERQVFWTELQAAIGREIDSPLYSENAHCVSHPTRRGKMLILGYWGIFDQEELFLNALQYCLEAKLTDFFQWTQLRCAR